MTSALFWGRSSRAWKLHAAVAGSEDKPAETTLFAQGVEIEKTGQPARPEVLEEMAKISKGRVIQPSQLLALVKEIETLPEPRPLENRIQLWSDWRVLTALISLLAIFWTGRKLSGVF